MLSSFRRNHRLWTLLLSKLVKIRARFFKDVHYQFTSLSDLTLNLIFTKIARILETSFKVQFMEKVAFLFHVDTAKSLLFSLLHLNWKYIYLILILERRLSESHFHER